MNKIEEFERDLKVAYLNYENNDLKETLKYLDRMLEIILKEDKSLENDPFWKTLTCDVFKAIVLNNFYNKIELTGNNLDSLLGNEEELKKNIKEFCNNFRNNELINFISHIENITDKPLKDIIKILMINIGKMNIADIKIDDNKEKCKHNWIRIDDEIMMVMMKKDDGSRYEVELGNFKCSKCGIIEKKDLLEVFNEQNPWHKYLEFDDNTLEFKLKNDTPEEIRKKYNEYKKNISNESSTANTTFNKNDFINREEIIEKIKYLSEEGDKRKNYTNISDFIIDEINIIKNIMENNFAYNIKYVPCLRAKHCIEEFDFNLESNQLEQCFYNIYEVIESDKNHIYHNLTEKSSGYEYSKLISSEEKNTILDMIERLIAKLKLSEKKYNDTKSQTLENNNKTTSDSKKGFLRKLKRDESGNFYEEEIEIDLNFPQELPFKPEEAKIIFGVSKILDMHFIDVSKNSKRISEENATYYYNPTRGGKCVIVSDDGSYLSAASSVNFDKHLEEFKIGKRNGNFNDTNENNDKILKINCHSCNNEIVIDCSKLPTNIKTFDTMCPNCKSFIKYGNLNYVDEKIKEDAMNKTDQVYSKKFNDYDIKNILCPNCNELLMLLMPDGNVFCCNKCNKCFKNDNGNVGDETTSPYTRNDVLY